MPPVRLSPAVIAQLDIQYANASLVRKSGYYRMSDVWIRQASRKDACKFLYKGPMHKDPAIVGPCIFAGMTVVGSPLIPAFIGAMKALEAYYTKRCELEYRYLREKAHHDRQIDITLNHAWHREQERRQVMGAIAAQQTDEQNINPPSYEEATHKYLFDDEQELDPPPSYETCINHGIIGLETEV